MKTFPFRSFATALTLFLIAGSLVAPRHSAGASPGVVLPNGWRLTPAGTPIALPGDLPLKMAFSPDGKSLLVTTGGYHDHGVTVIDRATGKIVQNINLGKVWAGMCFGSGGKDLYVAGGGTPSADFLKGAAKAGATAPMLEGLGHPIFHLAYRGSQWISQAPIDIDGLKPNARFTAGLVSGADGALYAVNIQNDTVYKLSAQTHTVLASAQAGYRPYAAALSADGKTLAVSNWGSESVSLLNATDLTEQARVSVGNHPNELVWGRDGRLFVANAGSNSVSVIHNGSVVETIKTSLDPQDPVGSTPDALALSSDGKRLYIANADNNDVAVVDTSNPQESRVLGFLPTGWYPSALAVAPGGKTLYVGTGKGLGFRGNATPILPPLFVRSQPINRRKYDYIGGILSGTVSAIRLPDADGLKAYTQQVYANTPGLIQKNAQSSPKLLVPFGKIKHVLYIIRENRTYDQVFGDIPKGNGDPSLTIFGAQTTPNAHALASQYVLLDNLYCNGEVSEDGHRWCDAAYATDFVEKAWPNSYSGRGEPDADDRLTVSPAGNLWDNCRRHGLTYYAYGEEADFTSTPNAPPTFTGDKGLEGHASAEYAKIGWFDPPRDIGRAEIFLRDLQAAEKTGDWPQFIVMGLPEDHTQGLSAGAFTPTAHVAENDQGLGRIVDGLSHSRFWDSTAIFVIEDDAQDGPDHVDAHRTVGLVISPYVKRGVTDSAHYSTASMVRTMEMILGLPPMTQFDRNAAPMVSSFQSTPDLTAYTCLAPLVDLDARNPPTGPGAAASAKLDFSAPDRADPDALNAILWNALKPGIPMPAPVRSARRAR